MATAASEDVVAGIAASLSVEDIPVKLRCATCSLIAYNALRLPCCEQNICETCYKELVDVCQVCHHEPLDKTLCTPNKSLRTTTKVFLKRKLLEREKDQKKRESEATALHAAAGGQVAATTPTLEISTTGGVQISNSEAPISATSNSNQTAGNFPVGNTTHAADDQVEADQKQPEGGENVEAQETSEQDGKGGADVQEAGASTEQSGLWAQGVSQDAMNQQQSFNQMNGMNNMGGFPMDMSTMMAMGAMPNMMGMGMDPMMNAMASSMFGGFGGPNMGMGGMNMGMGQSQFGGPWMADQDSYNGNAQGNARFGNQTGYNMPSHQGNFNQMNQQYPYNDFQSGYGRPGFYGRGGRGRRGGFRGGYAYQNHGYVNQGNYNHGNNNFPNTHQSQHQESSNDEKRDQQTNQANADAQTSLDNPNEGRTFIPGNSSEEALVADQEERDNAELTALAVDSEKGATDEDQVGSDKPKPIQSFISDEPSRNPPSGPSGAAAGSPTNVVAPVQHRFPEPRAIGVPGAPTGPRALREGLPNTGRSGLAYSRLPQTQASTRNGPSRTSRSRSPAKEAERPHRSRSRSLSRSRSRSRARSRSRSPSQERANRRQSHRRRSHSESAERQQDQSGNSYEELAHTQTYHNDDEAHSQRRDSHQSERHREAADATAKPYRKDENEYGRESPDHRFERDYDRGYNFERQGERQHYRDDDHRHDTGDTRYHDRRSRSPSQRRESPPPREERKYDNSRKRRNREDDYEEDHGHERGHNRRDRHHRKRSRRHRSSSRDRDNRYQPLDREDDAGRRGSFAANAGSQPPTGPRESGKSRGDERRRNRRRRGDSGNGRQHANTSTASAKDPHTLEREARDRERLMKEMQRRATADGGRGQRDSDRRRGSGQYEGDSNAVPRKDRGGRRRR